MTAERDPDERAAPPTSPAEPTEAERRGVGEMPPVLGGRMLIAVVMLVLMATIASQPINARIDRWLYPRAPRAAAHWKPGEEASVQLTLITDDYRRLSCADDRVVDGAHCAYQADKRHWPRKATDPVDDNKQDVIQPYRTADTNQLILVAGLWAEPELALRLHREPPYHYKQKKQLRFVAYCRVRFVGELTETQLRWKRGAKWQDKQTGLVARPLSCTLSPPQG